MNRTTLPPWALFGALLFTSWTNANAQAINGRVVESEILLAVGGAMVTVLDADLTVRARGTTDAFGVFRFDNLSTGQYSLQAEAYGRFSAVFGPVTIGTAAADSVLLTIPSAVIELSAGCVQTERDAAVLAGIVSDDFTGVPIPGAAVEVSWTVPGRQGNALYTTTDAAGRYRFCTVPAGRHITLKVSAFGRSAELVVDVPDVHVARADVALSRLAASSLRLLRVDALAPGIRGAVLIGRILHAGTGEAVSDAQIRIPGTGIETASSIDGTFRLAGIPPGEILVEIEHLAYGLHRDAIRAAAGMQVQVDVSLVPRAIVLPSVAVDGRAGEVAADRTRPSRITVAAGEALAAAEMRGARVADVLRTMPGIQLMQGAFESRYGPGTGYCVSTNRRAGRLHVPERRTTLPWCDSLPIYVDDVPVSDPIGFLRNLSVMDYESIELLDPLEAGARYGREGSLAGGVLVLYTRGRGPHVSRHR